jgi:hypothetical protein
MDELLKLVTGIAPAIGTMIAGPAGGAILGQIGTIAQNADGCRPG